MPGGDAPQALRARDDAPPVASALPEDLLDELDMHGVPGELIRHWAAQEEKVLDRLTRAGKAAEPMPAHTREATLRCLTSLAYAAGLQECWLDAALLLDLVWLGGRLSVQSLPAACAAVVMLLRKNESSAAAVRPANLATGASQLARWLCSAGYAGVAEVTGEAVRQQEGALLEALSWQINLPSVRCWITAFCSRFSIISRGMFSDSVEWIRQHAMATAQVLVLKHAASKAMAPRQIATGLFCVFAVMAQLVPLDALRPIDLMEDEWVELFSAGHCNSVPTCALPPARWDGMFSMLRLVSGCGSAALQADTRAVAAALRDAVMGFRVAPRG